VGFGQHRLCTMWDMGTPVKLILVRNFIHVESVLLKYDSSVLFNSSQLPKLPALYFTGNAF